MIFPGQVKASSAMTFLDVLFQAEVQKMRVEMAAMKRDAEHYSRQVTSLIDLLFTFHFLFLAFFKCPRRNGREIFLFFVGEGVFHVLLFLL